MSLAADLQMLEQQRERELTLLRTRFSALADTLEYDSSPAQWVRKHPYVAAGSAALLGFVAAQLPGKHTTPAVPSAPPPPAPPPAPEQASKYAAVLALLAGLARDFFPPREESASATPCSLRIADAGAVVGSAFPRSFAETTESPAESPGIPAKK